RSDRLIKFAQLQIGATAGLLFFELARHAQFVLLVRELCPRCFPGVSGDDSFLQSNPTLLMAQLTGPAAHHRYDLSLAVNFVLSLLLSLLLAVIVGYVLYVLVVVLFKRAPRLIATVVTIAAGQLLATAAAL